MNRSDIEDFFKTLLLGDFEENQSASGQVVGGLISLIPVLGQVMAARDITANVYAVGARGGFKSATSGQLVNLGFAAFGAIPEVGSVFKTVFKPMWKERQAAKGVVHSGLQAIESMLGMRKGGAIAWIRQELLGKWAALTTQAIAAVNLALDACIDLTQFLATAGGWKSWLIPSSVQALAQELLPQLQGLKGTVDAPLQRASNEIREFLNDLLGEQAAAVVMAVGQNAVMASAVPATRSRSGHNAADVHPKGGVPARQGERKVQAGQEAQAEKGQGPVHTIAQKTAQGLQNLAAREKGLVGEHMVDFSELKRLGGQWPHDQEKGQWSPESVKKLNVDKRPVNLALHDLPKVTWPGIDAVWLHGGSYTVTEAKASLSIGTVYGMGKAKEKRGSIPVVTGLNPDQQLLHYLLTDSSDKGGAQSPLMQMSVAWVDDRAKREGLQPAAVKALSIENSVLYHRRVVLVSFESQGALDHAQAWEEIQLGKPVSEVHAHEDHGVTRVWEAAAIDAVNSARERAHEAKRAEVAQPTTPPGTKSKKSKSGS